VITGPFVMRRLKTDPNIISDLPEKMVNNAWCSLEKKQASMYESVVRECLADIKGSEAGIQRRGLVLKMLTNLKQVCNHPAQYLGKGSPGSGDSGKAAALLGIIENILSLHEKVLIFTQYRQMGEILVKMLHGEAGVEAQFLHGGLTRKKRDEMVKAFQEDIHQKVFILSLKAGGTGLNLTAANHVIHYDLWWNPAVENQATDRAFRIGQKKNVIVHRLLCKGTLEEKIDAMLTSKKELADITVSQGETWIGDLSDKDLQKMVTLEM
jgi:SNF2 family DNA or RNA helicase